MLLLFFPTCIRAALLATCDHLAFAFGKDAISVFAYVLLAVLYCNLLSNWSISGSADFVNLKFHKNHCLTQIAMFPNF